jgi:hypothetical protein
MNMKREDENGNITEVSFVAEFEYTAKPITKEKGAKILG